MLARQRLPVGMCVCVCVCVGVWVWVWVWVWVCGWGSLARGWLAAGGGGVGVPCAGVRVCACCMFECRCCVCPLFSVWLVREVAASVAAPNPAVAEVPKQRPQWLGTVDEV